MNIMIIYTRINCGALGGVGTRVYLKIMIGLSGSVIEALHSVSHIASVNALSLHSRAQGIDFNDREPLGRPALALRHAAEHAACRKTEPCQPGI